jgi:hypothetical protein
LVLICRVQATTMETDRPRRRYIWFIAHETMYKETILTGAKRIGEGTQHGEENLSFCIAWCGVMWCAVVSCMWSGAREKHQV